MSVIASVTPKGQPSVWNLSYAPNPYFVGREDVLEQIEHGFTTAKQRKPVQVIWGMGGMGKTSVAAEYAFRRQDHYDIVWWVRAETQATIASDLAKLGARLSTSGNVREWNRQASHIALRELNRRSRWLLIFDNANRAQDLTAYLPEGSGDVLITTSNPSWSSSTNTIPLNAWTPDEAVDFLRHRLGSIDDEHSAARLAKALNHLPLALEQAGACIEQTHISLNDYIQEFEKLWSELFGLTKPAGNYPTAAAMAWELSFRRVEAIDLPAAALLNLCAFLSPDDIPFRMILDAAEHLPDEMVLAAADPIRFAESLKTIRDFSLARASEKMIALHGVIAALAQDRLSDEEREKWCAAAVIVASNAFRYDSQDPRTWPSCGEALPHALAAAFNAQRLGVVPAVASDLLSRAGRYLLKQAQYTEARDVLETALNLVHTAFGASSAQAADVANNLGRACHRMGDLEDATKLYESAMAIDLAAYGPQDPHRATVANNLGMSLVAKGQPQQARELFEWALSVYQLRYGQDHPRVAGVMNNLGFVLMQLDEPEIARDCLEKALQISQAAYGTGHTQVACISMNLAGILKSKGDLIQAKQLLERALLIDQNALGLFHPAIARDLSHLGQLLAEEKDFAGAARNYERALLICESAFGSDHRKTAACLTELGKALMHTGETDKAGEYLHRAAAISSAQVQNPGLANLGDDELISRD
ncbi:MAG: FxSxx-COOH system tetratricopeptide repeat protein [Planctomycetota bacterium]|nr:FxSxx-COOH system tetratricopeptide repeat protein [Planctomycetota bacterium]